MMEENDEDFRGKEGSGLIEDSVLRGDNVQDGGNQRTTFRTPVDSSTFAFYNYRLYHTQG